MDFLNNCVSVDEFRLNINMISHSAHFLCETPAVVTIPSCKATCHDILGTVLAIGVVIIKVRILQTFKRARSLEHLKKKMTTIKSASKGTKVDHNLVFISKTLGCMDKVSKWGLYTVVYDYLLYNTGDLAVDCDHKYVHPLPCSPKLILEEDVQDFRKRKTW